MMLRDTVAQGTDEHVCAALVAAHGRVALVVGNEGRWRLEPGCVFVPVELPGGAYAEGNSPGDAIMLIGQRWLGCPLRLQSADGTYGPSPAHAIDRLPLQAAPAPLLYLERAAPADPERGTGLRRVTVEVFRATIDAGGGDMASDDMAADLADRLKPQPACAGLLLLSWQALRRIVHGLSLADLLARDDVSLRCRSEVALPPETLIYLTSEYGERTLLRVAAKYGVQALGKDIGNGTGF